jgi:hypothetical protein
MNIMSYQRISKFLGISFAVFIGWYALAYGQSPSLRIQGPVQSPEVSSEILAFMEPIEVIADDDELNRKLTERHNAGALMLKDRVEEYRAGRRDLNDVFEAARLVALSKLDLASTDEQRRAALEQTLEVAQQIESSQNRQVELGFGSKGDLERARYARLGVEVEILKLKPSE